MSRVLSWAVACRWLEKNPCAGVKLPHAGSRIKRTILKSEETIEIARKLDEPYSTLILFLAVSGLRISEAIGIKWSHFEGDVLRIRRRIYEGKTGSTKNEHSERSLPIPSSLRAPLNELADELLRDVTKSPSVNSYSVDSKRDGVEARLEPGAC